MGIDISSHAGLGVLIPPTAAKESGLDRWDFDEKLQNFVYTEHKNLDVVAAWDTWSGIEEGWVVFAKSTMADSNREFVFHKVPRHTTDEEAKSLQEVALKFTGHKLPVAAYFVVTVT